MPRTRTRLRTGGAGTPPRAATTFYVSALGSDANNGTSTGTPFQTLAKVNSLALVPGDTISFRGGDTFTGTLGFTGRSVLTINSYGTGQAIFTPSANTANVLDFTNCDFLTIDNVKVLGLSTTLGTSMGIICTYMSDGTKRWSSLVIKNCDISTVASYGLFVYCNDNTGSSEGLDYVDIQNNTVHDIGGDASGLVLYGAFQQNQNYGSSFRGGYVRNNTVYNVTGKATGGNGSGSGIIVGQAANIIVQNNIVHDCGSTGNACVGLWTYEVNGITIQYNEVYNQGTGTTDGGGIDLDVGSKNCIVQYNYTRDNKGAGLMLYASPSTGYWGNTGNIIRFNISERDGNTGHSQREGFFTSNDNTQLLSGNIVHNNVFWTNKSTCRGVKFGTGSGSSKGTGNYFVNNIIYTTDTVAPVLVEADIIPTGWVLSNNVYYSSNGTFTWKSGGTSYSTMANWRAVSTVYEPNNAGLTSNPTLTGTLPVSSSAGWVPANLTAYKLLTGSPAINAGIVLSSIGFTAPSLDAFNGTVSASQPDIGVHEF